MHRPLLLPRRGRADRSQSRPGRPYRVLRHPAYTGNPLVALGLGIMFGDWVSPVVAIVFAFAGHLPRIRAKEAELEGALGEQYRRCEEVTARLVPRVW